MYLPVFLYANIFYETRANAPMPHPTEVYHCSNVAATTNTHVYSIITSSQRWTDGNYYTFMSFIFYENGTLQFNL